MSAITIFGNVIVLVIALALVAIAIALISIARSFKTQVIYQKYSVVMNHLGLGNQLSFSGDILDDEAIERMEDTIKISKKYVEMIAPEEYKED